MYFGHKKLTIFTAACYFQENITVENGKLDEESNLVKFLVAIILNETSYHQNFAFTNNNNWLISMVKNIAPILLLVKLLNEKFTGKFCPLKLRLKMLNSFLKQLLDFLILQLCN